MEYLIVGSARGPCLPPLRGISLFLEFDVNWLTLLFMIASVDYDPLPYGGSP